MGSSFGPELELNYLDDLDGDENCLVLTHGIQSALSLLPGVVAVLTVAVQ